MDRYADDFGSFNGHVWLDTAHQGALPKVAAAAAHEAVAWKAAPYKMTPERFRDVPRRLREGLGRIVNTPADEVILANSSSYGLHLLANGIPWQRGDEVLVVRGDFPSTILPWMGLHKQGVVVREIEPGGDVLQVDDVEQHRTARTRLLCTTWVHSFTGNVVDEQALGAWCRAHGITFVLNGSQGIGARRLDLARTPVDAVTSVGFKWMCGPYGTGFCWIRPELLDTLSYNQIYWLSMLTAEDLEESQTLTVRGDLGARHYDVFGTANFFNFTAWIASIEYLLEQGIRAIHAHNQRLVSRFIEGLDEQRYALRSPRADPGRSSLVFIAHHDQVSPRAVYERLREARIHMALRRGLLRISPHLYNTVDDIDRLLEVLHA